MAIGAFSTRLYQRLPALVLRVMLAAPLLTLIVPTSTAARQAPSFAFSLELVADGFAQPVQVVDPGDGSGRLFVVEQIGRIRIIRDGQVMPDPFLDISDRVSCCGERGLLSLAFHPDFVTNGMFFVDYTDVNGDTVVARYHVAADALNRADAASAETMLTVDQPAANHNGGLLLFGPRDGYLYIGFGDGGGGNGQNGQDLGTLLGKILRIDIDASAGGLPYGIPPGNPFVDQSDARPEIWLFGVRNPWRFSFDRATGDLWIGDVGSAIYEEINRQPALSTGGENYGWDLMEGPECRAEDGCAEFVAPVSGFSRSEGCVVTGGYVYRGSAAPELEGTYLFADYCSGKVWGLTQDDSGVWARLGPVETGLRISSFGEDATGEVYVVDLQGAVYRVGAA
ncbi:MAG: PQQ-dependent sugar dehydrogenase [Thermomicrobiales bacterium]